MGLRTEGLKLPGTASSSLISGLGDWTGLWKPCDTDFRDLKSFRIFIKIIGSAAVPGLAYFQKVQQQMVDAPRASIDFPLQ